MLRRIARCARTGSRGSGSRRDSRSSSSMWIQRSRSRWHTDPKTPSRGGSAGAITGKPPLQPSSPAEGYRGTPGSVSIFEKRDVCLARFHRPFLEMVGWDALVKTGSLTRPDAVRGFPPIGRWFLLVVFQLARSQGGTVCRTYRGSRSMRMVVLGTGRFVHVFTDRLMTGGNG